MQLAADYSLHNQTATISGPFLDCDPMIIIEAMGVCRREAKRAFAPPLEIGPRNKIF